MLLNGYAGYSAYLVYLRMQKVDLARDLSTRISLKCANVPARARLVL